MIIGSDDEEPRPNSSKPDDADYFNSSFLISPQGELIERYVKRNLVIFGEYIPLRRWLPFLKYLTPIEAGFTAGTKPVPFHLPTLGITVQVLICFEDVFPQLARQEMRPETDLLVNLTNDGWFGESGAPGQHLNMARMRAIENHRWLLRATNTGITSSIDPFGRVVDRHSATCVLRFQPDMHLLT